MRLRSLSRARCALSSTFGKFCGVGARAAGLAGVPVAAGAAAGVSKLSRLQRLSPMFE